MNDYKDGVFMKKIVLSDSLIMGITALSPLLSPTIEAEAKVNVLTKDDVDAIKAGSVLHAKAALGQKEKELIKKGLNGVQTENRLEYTQNRGTSLNIVYSFSLYNAANNQIDTFKTVKVLTASYDQKMNFSIFDKHLKRVKQHDVVDGKTTMLAYQSGEKYVLITKNAPKTTLWLFSSKRSMEKFLAFPK